MSVLFSLPFIAPKSLKEYHIGTKAILGQQTGQDGEVFGSTSSRREQALASIGIIRWLHGLKRDVVSSVGRHGLIPVIGSVLGRPEAGSRPSERRECGLETPENDSSYWIGAWETRSW